LRRGPQLKDQFPRLTGARFIASLTAVFDLDFHEFVLATMPKSAISFDTSGWGLTRRNFVINPARLELRLMIKLCCKLAEAPMPCRERIEPGRCRID
jgi:hypothetical protein